jgi:hypothetical protein
VEVFSIKLAARHGGNDGLHMNNSVIVKLAALQVVVLERTFLEK